MSKQQVKTLRPFLSILIIMGFLFVFAFIKMENRRMGYSLVKLTQQEKQMRHKHREKILRLAKMTGPERVRLIATERLPMRKAHHGQIIQMSLNGVAILQ